MRLERAATYSGSADQLGLAAYSPRESSLFESELREGLLVAAPLFALGVRDLPSVSIRRADVGFAAKIGAGVGFCQISGMESLA